MSVGNEAAPTIGIIAGNGAYPRVFVEAARRRAPHARLVVAAFENETRPELLNQVDASAWFRVGQLGRPLKFFKKEGVTEAIMVGQIAPKNLFNLRPDMRTLKVLAKLPERNAESLFGAVAKELELDGVTLLPATTYLEDLLPDPGHVFGPILTERQLGDVEFGFRTAKETSRLDIGQTVVVRHGTVLAVEAFEGTNECIRRGGKLGRGKNVMLVKVSKPNQDFRFDVPVVGPQTIETCAEAGVGAIAIEANRTLLLESEIVREACERYKISLHSVGMTAAEDQVTGGSLD
ncbi:MAG: LpxI family protein [Verrucomicrobiales bacterium]